MESWLDEQVSGDNWQRLLVSALKNLAGFEGVLGWQLGDGTEPSRIAFNKETIVEARLTQNAVELSSNVTTGKFGIVPFGTSAVTFTKMVYFLIRTKLEQEFHIS